MRVFHGWVVVAAVFVALAVIFGVAYDLSGSYTIPIAASSVLILGSLACALALRHERGYA